MLIQAASDPLADFDPTTLLARLSDGLTRVCRSIRPVAEASVLRVRVEHLSWMKTRNLAVPASADSVLVSVAAGVNRM